jgi:undecaprenyl-diphosphatase
MIQRKYNLNLCLAIAVSAVLLTLILGALQKQYGILTPANILAFQFVKSVQTFPLTVTMTGLTWFGEALGLMIFICIMYWLGYTTEIITFLLMVIFGSAISEHMKEFFGMQRPVPSEVPAIAKAKGFGYPSGHSQSGMYYSWLMYAFIGKYWLLCLIPALLLVFSRIYLGVHYFSDTVGGLILGFGVAAGATGIYGYVRDLDSLRESIRRSPALRVVLPLALSIGYMIVAWGQPDAFKYGGFLFGFFLIYPALGFRWRSRNPFFAIIAIILGLAVLLGLQIGGYVLPRVNFINYLNYFVQGVILAISPWLFVKIGLLKKLPKPELEVVEAGEKKEVGQPTGV